MILRSQLRMNKNIVFPFISCIMIMLTLLVLIHKSADELNTTKKELNLCKQQHDSMYTQLQNAVELKLHLEKTLENEKVEGRQKLDDLQTSLNEEREKNQKAKDEADKKFVSLNQECNIMKSENKEYTDTVETLNKKILDLDNQLSEVREQLKSVHSDNERKDNLIKELKERTKDAENPSEKQNKLIQAKGVSPSGSAGQAPNNLAPGQNGSQGLKVSTPEISSDALKAEEYNKQVGPAPNVEESPQLKDQQKKLGAKDDTNAKVNQQENAEKAPPLNGEEDKNQDNQVDNQIPIAQNQDAMNIPLPFNNKQASSISNNAAHNQEALPAAVPQLKNENEKIAELAKGMKDFGAAGDYDNNVEDEGEDYDNNDSRLVKNKKAAQGND